MSPAEALLYIERIGARKVAEAGGKSDHLDPSLIDLMEQIEAIHARERR